MTVPGAFAIRQIACSGRSTSPMAEQLPCDMVEKLKFETEKKFREA